MIRVLSVISRRRASDSLAVWENEGGASPPSHDADKLAAARWTPSYTAIQYGSGGANFHGADIGIDDRHTLGVLQTSLALLVLALMAMMIFWNGPFV